MPLLERIALLQVGILATLIGLVFLAGGILFAWMFLRAAITT